MITLNRLGHSDEPFQLNPDMIVTVESTPDTVITLATGAKVVVAETPEEVAAAVHAYRAERARRGAAQPPPAAPARPVRRHARVRPAHRRRGRPGLAARRRRQSRRTGDPPNRALFVQQPIGQLSRIFPQRR